MASMVERPGLVQNALQQPQQGYATLPPQQFGQRQPMPQFGPGQTQMGGSGYLPQMPPQRPPGPLDMYGRPVNFAPPPPPAYTQNQTRQTGVLPPMYAGGSPTWQGSGQGAVPPPPTMQSAAMAQPAPVTMPPRQPLPPLGQSGAPMAPGVANGIAIPSYRPGMQQGMQQGLMSDETKKQISQPSIADQFLDELKPYTYKYKNPADEPRAAPTGGDYLGVMAQDVERVPEIGQQLILDTPHGKMIDKGVAISALLAAAGRLNERVRALESDVTRRRK